MLQARTGPLGFQYRLPANDQVTPVSGDAGDDESNWLIPKHHILANFGIFNPAGPTVGSLEVGIRDEVQYLFYVVRHPFSPECVFLASASLDQGVHAFRDGLQHWFSNNQWSPIDWMHVYEEDLEEPIRQGLIDFALHLEPDELRRHVETHRATDDPWIRVSSVNEPRLSSSTDPLEDWVPGIGSDLNFANYQAFLKSAWEGAKVFAVEPDPSLAQSTADFVASSVKERCFADAEQLRDLNPPLLAPLGFESAIQ
jgi:hypothetical protein